MIIPSVDKLAEKVESRYTLVMLAAKRTKQLRDGAPKLIETTSTNPLTIALEEIAAGKVTFSVLSHDNVVPSALEPEFESLPSVAEAEAEAAEITAEAAPVVDEATRIAELLKVPAEEEAEAEVAEPAQEEEAEAAPETEAKEE